MTAFTTFEEYFMTWLSRKVSRDFKTVLTRDAVDLLEVSGQDMDKYVRVTSLRVQAFFKDKRTSAETLAGIQNALYDLKKENFILDVQVGASGSQRIENPSGWSYQAVIDVRHRRLTSWQL